MGKKGKAKTVNRTKDGMGDDIDFLAYISLSKKR
jgi:hypothetical protein